LCWRRGKKKKEIKVGDIRVPREGREKRGGRNFFFRCGGGEKGDRHRRIVGKGTTPEKRGGRKKGRQNRPNASAVPFGGERKKDPLPIQKEGVGGEKNSFYKMRRKKSETLKSRGRKKETIISTTLWKGKGNRKKEKPANHVRQKKATERGKKEREKNPPKKKWGKKNERRSTEDGFKDPRGKTQGDHCLILSYPREETHGCQKG